MDVIVCIEILRHLLQSPVRNIKLSRAILARAQKERKATGKTSILEQMQVILSRVSVGMWVVKAILMRSPAETRNMLLETGGKSVPVIKW